MSNGAASVSLSGWSHLDDDDDNDLLLLEDDINLNTSSLRSDDRYVGFDNNVGDTWLYPSNFPERSYQYNIVQKALYHNTLVVLPTGLGKTFIAAVVMYNIYRWYPMGKVIFMAPTRPLVAQQIDACCQIMGIPKEDSVEITGKLNKANRAQLWQSKRVFFATPQSVQSDMADGELNFPFDSVKLIVVDEAHRAKGRYAYTEVVNLIWRKNKYFRILALSATPGRRKDDVEEVIRNLFISKLEVRTDDSIDVVSYVHKREMKTVVVKLGPKLSEIRDELLAITDPHIRNLIDHRLISGRPGSISRNWLVMEQKRFRESLANNRVPQQKELNSDFSICISIYYAIELLERHGLRVFLNNFDETEDSGPKFVLILRPDLRRLVERVRQEIGPNPFAYSDQSMVNGEIAPIPKNVDFGHPKFEIARDHVLAHFEHNKEARAIIFCEYRESVMLMHRLLLQQRPLIRPRIFVGQGGTGSIRAVTQQQQIKVMNDFRSGESNALIATSVAEEGIDVGEVDLIVCFDISTTNPTRFIQRIGRTGRKKAGKVILLATEGKEHMILKDVLSEQNKLNKSLSRGSAFSAAFYKHAPRMVPTEFNPKCLKTFIPPTIPKESMSKVKPTSSKGKQMAKITQKHDLRHFFKQKVLLDDEDKHIFEDVIKPVTTKAAIGNSPKSNSIKSFVLEEDQAIMDFSPPKELDISGKTVKKIAKYIRNSVRGQPVDIQKSITSNKLTKESLEFLLDYSPDLLVNIWTCMQALWKRGINENNLPTKGITPEDRQAVRVYLQLLNVFGEKKNVAAAVKTQSETDKTFHFSNLIEKYDFVFGSAHQCDGVRTNFEYLMEMCPLSSDQCSSASFTHSAVYDDEVDEVDHTVQSFNESNDQIMDSKYMSQWATSNNEISYVCESPLQNAAKTLAIKNPPSDCDDDVIFVAQQSTPIRTGPLKQSLLNFQGTPISGKLSDRIFNKLKGRSFNSTSRENSLKKLDPGISVKRIEPSNEMTDDLFDDQFDDILAANSCIFEKIEHSNKVTQALKEVKTSPQSAVTPSCAQEETKTSCLGSNDSTPDNIVPLSKGDSTPKNVPAFVDHSNGIRSNENDKFKANCILQRNICDIRKSDSKTTESVQLNTNHNKSEVHPELADIDFNAFSETFSEETINHTNLSPSGNKSLQRSSPDIFDEDSIFDVNVKEKSPCKLIVPPQAQVSPCLLTKKPLTWKEVRLKYFKPSQIPAQNPVKKPDDDSVIILPSKSRTKRKIIDSDSDSSDNNPAPLRRSRNLIPDTQVEVPRVIIKSRRRANEFIDDQAELSGSATEDEFEETIGCYMMDSVVVHDDDVENDSSVNMTQVYLQSLRNPSVNARGAFKIPPRRQYNDASKIFSQRVLEEEDGSYMKDSFVISDEGSDVDQSMCPLERAEAILKEKRRAKRKAKLIGGYEDRQPAKKKRILRIHNSSEDDGSDFA